MFPQPTPRPVTPAPAEEDTLYPTYIVTIQANEPEPVPQPTPTRPQPRPEPATTKETEYPTYLVTTDTRRTFPLQFNFDGIAPGTNPDDAAAYLDMLRDMIVNNLGRKSVM